MILCPCRHKHYRGISNTSSYSIFWQLINQHTPPKPTPLRPFRRPNHNLPPREEPQDIKNIKHSALTTRRSLRLKTLTHTHSHHKESSLFTGTAVFFVFFRTALFNSLTGRSLTDWSPPRYGWSARRRRWPAPHNTWTWTRGERGKQIKRASFVLVSMPKDLDQDPDKKTHLTSVSKNRPALNCSYVYCSRMELT